MKWTEWVLKFCSFFSILFILSKIMVDFAAVPEPCSRGSRGGGFGGLGLVPALARCFAGLLEEPGKGAGDFLGGGGEARARK
jgi:hypothetical protein